MSDAAVIVGMLSNFFRIIIQNIAIKYQKTTLVFFSI